MDKINKLKEERKALVAQMRAMTNKAAAEKRDLNQDEQLQYDGIKAQVEANIKAEQRELEMIEFEKKLNELSPEEERAAQTFGAAATTPATQTTQTTQAAGGTTTEQRTRTHVEVQKQPTWSSLGEFLMAVRRDGTPGLNHSRDPLVTKLRASQEESRAITVASGMQESLPSDGGWLVQQEFAQNLLQRTYETGQVVSRAFKIPIGPGKNGIKILSISESSRANGSRWGGIQVYWTAEAEQLTASKPKFRQISLDLKKVTGLCYATDEMLEDASALEAIINRAFPEEFAFVLDDALLRGTGAGQPQGILNSACLVTVSKEVGQGNDTILADNIFKMWSRCWGRSRQNAVWFINQDIEPQLRKLSVPVGTGGSLIYMPPGGISGQQYSTLINRPIIPIEQCSTLGTVGDIILADFGEYVMIDKGSIKSDSSIHVRFLYEETAFRFTYRVDGQPSWNSALTPYQGSNTLSPFVVLESR